LGLLRILGLIVDVPVLLSLLQYVQGLIRREWLIVMIVGIRSHRWHSRERICSIIWGHELEGIRVGAREAPVIVGFVAETRLIVAEARLVRDSASKGHGAGVLRDWL
jgi:hypothetical protein